MRAMNGLEMLLFAVGRGADPADRRSQHPMSNIQHPMTNETDRRRGVALIIVLGFLTIMVLMAVAFLTQARVERMVADSTLEAMRGRQLMRTAMNAAMNDYSTYLWDEQLNVPAAAADKMFVSKPPTTASGMGGRSIGDDAVELLTGEAFDWIPRRYTNEPFRALTRVNDEAEWILVREDPANSQSRILGRYAYACFDSSGCIDANLIARSENIAAQDARAATNRFRHSVRDVPMGKLKETLDASEFKRLRRGWKGFDSLQSVIKLADGYYIDGSSGYESGDTPSKPPSQPRWRGDRLETKRGLDPSNVTDLVSFSLSAYRGGRYDRGTGKWTTPEPIQDGADWPGILADMNDQFASGWGSWIRNAIHDYTHDTSVPQGTDYPSPKNVPMFNEINVTYTLEEEDDPISATNSLYFLRLEMPIEFWYPFPSRDNKDPGTFLLPVPTVGGGRDANPADPNTELWIRLWGAKTGAGPGGIVWLTIGTPTEAPADPMSVEAVWNAGKPRYVEAVNKFTWKLPLNEMSGAKLPKGMTVRIQGLKVYKPIYLLGTGGNADMLPGEGGGASGPDGSLTFGPVDLSEAATKTVTQVKAVTDPRLNHLLGAWVIEDSSSLGEMNRWFTVPVTLATSGKKSNTAALDEGLCMYCRNGPMESPAELGFISVGKEWETIDLCTPEGADLMANLVTTNTYGQWSAGKGVVYTNGTINPNTRSTNVLLSAFYDLSAGEVPSQESFSDFRTYDGEAISEDLAGTLAQRIVEATDTETVPVGERLSTIFQAGSDWARIQAMRQGKEFAKIGLNNNQRESLIRNTWGLFSPEDSLFTVIVVAQAIKEGPGAVGIWNADDDMVTGERRAVALVWRDPFKTGANLHHEMFIRMIRYLND